MFPPFASFCSWSHHLWSTENCAESFSKTVHCARRIIGGHVCHATRGLFWVHRDSSCRWWSSRRIQAGEVFAKLSGFVDKAFEPTDDLGDLRVAFSGRLGAPIAGGTLLLPHMATIVLLFHVRRATRCRRVVPIASWSKPIGSCRCRPAGQQFA